MENIIYGIIVLAAIVFGFFIGKIISKSKNTQESAVQEEKNRSLQHQLENAEKLHSETKEELEKIRLKNESLQTELARRNADFSNLEEKNHEQQKEVEKLNEKFSKEFENLANKIFDEKSTKFTHQNKENIENVLKPLRERIKDFEEKVDKNRNESTKLHSELGEQLKFLRDQNKQITEEANNLTQALKGDTQKQGAWGEMILKRVLESSGLQKGSEYTEQEAMRNEEGRLLKPDFVIHLPGDKKMIIDSKVSLIAYERYCNASEEHEKESALKAHLQSIKAHVKGLSEKKYQHLYDMESPDFVLLFVPIEAAFAVASNKYPQLYSDAFDKNIIIVTPTTLLAVLKTIDSMWQNEKQKQNAIEIATQAGRMYDSFVNLTDELLKVGKQIKTVDNTYKTAMKKLTGRGNIVNRIETLKELGAKASKQVNKKIIERSREELE